MVTVARSEKGTFSAGFAKRIEIVKSLIGQESSSAYPLQVLSSPALICVKGLPGQ